jgi:hypothetical protein
MTEGDSDFGNCVGAINSDFFLPKPCENLITLIFTVTVDLVFLALTYRIKNSWKTLANIK